MASRESYTRRADRAHTQAFECKQKMRYKPASVETYKMLSDHALAEGFVMDSAARNFDEDPARMAAAMRRELELIQREGRSAFEHERFQRQVALADR